MSKLEDVAKIVHHGVELADGIRTNNTLKSVFSSMNLGFEVGKIIGDDNSLQSRFDNYVADCKSVVGANNPFVQEMERVYSNVDEQMLDNELQRLITAVESYLISNNLSTDMPLLNLIKSRYAGIIRSSDLDKGFVLVREIDILNIKRANMHLSQECLANILSDYEALISYIFANLRAELIRRGQIIA